MRTVQGELINKGLSQPRECKLERKSIRTRDKQSERLTDRELADLMGTNRDTYRRGPGGAFRRR